MKWLIIWNGGSISKSPPRNLNMKLNSLPPRWTASLDVWWPVHLEPVVRVKIPVHARESSCMARYATAGRGRRSRGPPCGRASCFARPASLLLVRSPPKRPGAAPDFFYYYSYVLGSASWDVLPSTNLGSDLWLRIHSVLRSEWWMGTPWPGRAAVRNLGLPE